MKKKEISLEQQIAGFGFLDKNEIKQITVDFNQTVQKRNHVVSIPELFEQIVTANADKIAIQYQDVAISYGELNKKVNQLSHHLISKGVGLENTIGIAMERSPEVLIAILAVLKTGAAYVIIDHSYPKALQLQLIGDSGAKWLIGHESTRDRLPQEIESQVICLTRDSGIINQASVDNPEIAIDQDNLAYILYTSGTTGVPKGVMVEHHGITNLVQWQAAHYEATPETRVTQLASFVFDASVGESYMALLNGLTLVMIDRHLTPKDLIDTLVRTHSDVWITVPSLLKSIDPKLLGKKQTIKIVSVGETCPPELAEQWSKYCSFMNAYGPTEFSVYSHMFVLQDNHYDSESKVPIGKPIFNAKSYILDANLEVVPVGSVGDIYLTGVAMTRGYLNLPDRTADTFIPNPFYDQHLFHEEPDKLVSPLFNENKQGFIDRINSQKNRVGYRLESRIEFFTDDRIHLQEAIKHTVDDDLFKKTVALLDEIAGNQYAYNCFIRYLSDALQNSYFSIGLDRNIINQLIPFDNFAGKKGLDFGFGNGETMQILQEMGADILGLDINPIFVQKARNNHLKAEMMKIDCDTDCFKQTIDIDEASQDFVMSTLIIDRLEKPRDFLRNFFYCLKDNGRFVLQVLLPILSSDDAPVKKPIRYTAEQHKISSGNTIDHDKAAIALSLIEQGAENIHIYRVPYIVASQDGIQEYLLWSFCGNKKERFMRETDNESYYQRLYKTGDLGRYLPDGSIEYCGRVDEQVKIRGIRIELESIEAQLKKHPKIIDAVVLCKETDRSKTLNAYLIVSEPQENLIQDIQTFLKEWLPSHSIPSGYFVVDSFPVTATSGKLDKRKLLEMKKPTVGTVQKERSFVSDQEEKLIQITKQVLGIDNLDPHDNLFEVGADSILVVQIANRAIQEGMNVTVMEFFNYQNIADICAAVKSEPAEKANPLPEPNPSDLPLSPIQEWFTQQKLPNKNHYNQAIILRPKIKLDADMIRSCLEYLQNYHDALRFRFFLDGDHRHINMADAEDNSMFDEIDLSDIDDKNKRMSKMKAVAQEIQESLNLETGPILKVALFQLGEDEQRLLWIAHHMIIDTQSWRVLLEDFHTAYEQLRSRQSIQLPPKPTPWGKWSQFLNQYDQIEDIKKYADYWKLDQNTWLALPVDKPDGINTNESFRQYRLTLTKEESEQLVRGLPQALHIRTEEIILSSLAKAYRNWTGSKSLLIGLERNGRRSQHTDLDVSGTVGWFTSYFPVALSVDEKATLPEEILSLKEQLRNLPDGGIPYGVLYYVSRNEQLQHRIQQFPKHEISFNYLGQLGQESENDKWLEMTDEYLGTMQSDDGIKDVKIEILCRILDGECKFYLNYSENVFVESTIEAFAGHILESLKEMLNQGQALESPLFSPSDFPLAQSTLSDLSIMQLNELLQGRAVQDIYPLTPLQQGIIYHSYYGRQSVAYFNQLHCELHGEFDRAALSSAIRDLIQLHQPLRTSFFTSGRVELLQLICKDCPLSLDFFDWSDRDESVVDQDFNELLATDRAKGFDLSQAPLARFIVIKTAKDRHKLVFDCHHAVLDGWSLSIVLRDLFALYRNYSSSEPAIALTKPHPIKDYMVWLEKRNDDTAKEYWKKTLTGYQTPALLRGLEINRVVSGKDRYGMLEVNLPKSASEKIEKFAKMNQVTVNTIIQATWALVTKLYSGVSDMVFGVTVSGRSAPVPGIESMTGLFINTLPLRLQIDDQHSVKDWLQALQKQNGELRQFEHTTLTDIHRWIGSEVAIPLFESILVFENYPQAEDINPIVSRLNIDKISVFERVDYPVVISAAFGKTLYLRFNYNRSRFEDEFMSILKDMFIQLMEVMIGSSDQLLSEIKPPCKTDERSFDPAPANALELEEHCIHRLVERQVERTPYSIALIDGDTHIDYETLNRKSNQAAYELMDNGLSTGDCCVVMSESSIPTIIAILGILKAGGVYVPVDPTQSDDITNHIINELAPKIILTDSGRSDFKPPKQHVLPFTSLMSRLEKRPDSNPDLGISGADLAYIMYTSGSTGFPKGVMGLHKAVANRLAWMSETHPFGSDEVVCQKTFLTFTDSIAEIFSPLTQGIPMVLVPASTVRDLPEFVSRLSRYQISRIVLIPSLLRIILEEFQDLTKTIPCLKYWMISGEAFPTDLAETFYECLPDAELINIYGSTEVTADVTYFESHPDLPLSPYLPIGRPISNTEIHLLDNELNPVPPYISGRIHVSGESITHGYYNNPESTACTFIPNPFTASPGSRLYDTGDLGFRNARGEIEYIGRDDNQVKVAGQRLEVGAIEAVINRHRSIRTSCVIVKDKTHDQLEINAFVEANTLLSEEDLRSYLKLYLANHANPTNIFFLKEWPRTSTGKIDRKKLKSVNFPSLPKNDKTHVNLPTTANETKILEFWQTLLEREHIGITDRFFEVGGNSMLIMRLHKMLHDHYPVKIAAVTLFEKPTVKQIAQHIEDLMQQSDPSDENQSARVRKRRGRVKVDLAN